MKGIKEVSLYLPEDIVDVIRRVPLEKYSRPSAITLHWTCIGIESLEYFHRGVTGLSAFPMGFFKCPSYCGVGVRSSSQHSSADQRAKSPPSSGILRKLHWEEISLLIGTQSAESLKCGPYSLVSVYRFFFLPFSFSF